MENFQGFEVGPIRPPSEASSLLLRVTRNCPWNLCHFCTLYKNEKFSLRSKEEILHEIDLLKKATDLMQQWKREGLTSQKFYFDQLRKEIGNENQWAIYSAYSWMEEGYQSVFLQDANALIMKSQDLIEILKYLRGKFPQIQRITSYARSHTVARITDEDMTALADAGLNRIHIGMETASDTLLKLVHKGVDKETHIKAGKKIKRTPIELSLYYMPGLGGTEYYRESALETADAMNQINPDFIRLRTLAVPDHSLLAEDYEKKIFTRAGDDLNVEEILIFIENLHGITSYVKSDHILNLIPEVKGKLPLQKEKMIKALKWYMDLSEEEKIIFRVGRRRGLFRISVHLNHQGLRSQVVDLIHQEEIDKTNVDAFVEEAVKRFI